MVPIGMVIYRLLIDRKSRFFESGGMGRVENEFGEPFSLFIPSWKRDGLGKEVIIAETRNVQEAFEMRQKKSD